MTYNQDITPPRRQWTGTLTISGSAEDFGALTSAISHVTDEILYELSEPERKALTRLYDEARDVYWDILQYMQYDGDK